MKQLAIQPQELKALEKVLIKGDLAGLQENERISYVNALCRALKISPLFQPFDYVAFQGRTQIYAKRSCAEQLRQNRSISIKIVNRERLDGVYSVVAQARDKSGREDESIGSVSIKGLGGKELANALMIAETKAKRRVTLSICGLGVLDELEVQEVVAKEVKEASEKDAIQVQAKIADTTSRPEFETQGTPELPPAESTEYILKAGKHSGKKISQLTEKQIKNWLDFYKKQEDAGIPVHMDIESDYKEILAFNDEKQMSLEEKK